MGPYGKGLPIPGVPGGIRQTVYEGVANAQSRMTASALERSVAQTESCSRRLVRDAIRWLIEEGLLEYRYTFGQSYLSLSFRRPVDVSSRFTIIPPGHVGKLPPERIPIAIAPGASFGDGRHPTTRLALQGLEAAWSSLLAWGGKPPRCVIDIGTGSGILAIAAACLGAASVLALDVDACARSEAEQNIRLNPEAVRVSVADRPIAAIDTVFDLVLANLRLPTLAQLGDWIHGHLTSPGCAVVSGCREEEWAHLTKCFAHYDLRSGWQGTLAGWSGGIFYREMKLEADRRRK